MQGQSSINCCVFLRSYSEYYHFKAISPGYHTFIDSQTHIYCSEASLSSEPGKGKILGPYPNSECLPI